MAAWVIPAIIAGVSAVSGMIGGSQQDSANKKNSKAQAKYNKEAWKRDERERKDTFRWASRQVELQEYNDKNAAAYRDTVQKEDWAHEMRIQDYDFASKVSQFNQSEKQYAQQVDYNAIAATIARDEQALWLDEKLLDIEFQNEDLLLNSAKQIDDITFKSKHLAVKKGSDRDQFSTERQAVALEQQFKRAETSFKLQDNRIKKLQAEGQVRAMGQAGRSARKNRQSVLAMAGMQQSALIGQMSRTDSMFGVKDQQIFDKYKYARLGSDIEGEKLISDADFVADTRNLGQRKLEASADSAHKRNRSNLQRIDHDQYGADMAAENNRMAPPEDMPRRKAPYSTPRTEFMKPRMPEKLTKPMGAMATSNAGLWSGISSGLGTIGSVATAFAKP